MAVTDFTCTDCKGSFPRTGSRGPIPKRCDPCRSHKRAGQTAQWHAAHPDAQKRYTAERTARHTDERGTRICPVCDSSFAPKRARSIYCSKPCGSTAHGSADLDEARATLKRRRAARAHTEAEPTCEQCGREPRRTGESGRPARFCSDTCLRAWHNRLRRHYPSAVHGKNDYAHRQRAAAHGASDIGVTRKQWAAILAFYGDRCAYCGSDALIERDHVVPITRSGGHEPDNVVPACRPCNRSKGDQLLEEWRPGLTLDRIDVA